MNKNYLFQEIVVKNPVLIGTIGLCPVVAICTSLKAALIMSLVTILTLIVAQALSSLVLRHFPQWFRMSLYMLVGMFVVVPCILLVEKIDPATMVALGIYLPLLAVNPIIVRQCEREGVNIGLAESFVNSLCAGFGYSAVLIVVGVVREIFGNGTVWGIKILPIVPAAGMLMPMGGFVVLAFMAAILRAYFRKIDPAYAEELAVNSRTAIKGGAGLKALLLDIEEPEDTPRYEFISMENTAPAEPVSAEPVAVEEQPVAAPAPVPAPAPEAVPEAPKTAADEIEQILKEVSAEFAEEPAVVGETAEEEAVEEAIAEVAAVAAEYEISEETISESAEEKVSEEPKPAPQKKAKSEGLFGKRDKNGDKNSSKKSGKKTGNKRAKKAEKATTAKNADKKAQEPVAPPVAAPETQKPKYEFITLELPSAAEKKKEESKKRAKKAMDEARETAAKINEPVFAAPISEEEAKAETSTAKKKTTSNIVYRSDELERLMSMSLDDILDSLPQDGGGEEGDK